VPDVPREQPLLSSRFKEALGYALDLHAGQLRKGSKVPYAAHLLAVAAIILDHGGDEELAIAGLLHDAVEDQGGPPTLEAIRRRFGKRVADIVDQCSDTDAVPKPPWRERKEHHLAILAGAGADVRFVYAADKLHNARAILRDLQNGESTWDRFNGGKEGTLWYYDRMVEVLGSGGSNPIAGELEAVVAELKRAAISSTPHPPARTRSNTT